MDRVPERFDVRHTGRNRPYEARGKLTHASPVPLNADAHKIDHRLLKPVRTVVTFTRLSRHAYHFSDLTLEFP